MYYLKGQRSDRCLGKRNRNIISRLHNVETDKSACERDVGVMIGRDLKPREQCISEE